MRPTTRSMTITIKSSPELRLEFRKEPAPGGGVELVVTVSAPATTTCPLTFPDKRKRRRR